MMSALWARAFPGKKPTTGKEDCLALEQALDRVHGLDLRSQNVSDVAPLRGILNLTELNLRDNGVMDVSPLAELRSLRRLNLANNQVTSVSELFDLGALETMHLGFNNVADVRPLQHLMSLKELRLQGNRITDFSPVQSLPHLGLLLRTPAQACAEELSVLARLGELSVDDAVMMRTMGLGPRYRIQGDPRSGVEGMYACNDVVRTY